MSKFFLVAAAVLGALSVALGAFAAHGLKKIVSPDVLVTFETGVRYQFYHTFALLATGILLERIPGQSLTWAGYSFLVGIILFSGSLYLMVGLKAAQNAGLGAVGIITPIGGLFLITGWIFLLTGILKKN